jgi:magnesium chelatase subunit H
MKRIVLIAGFESFNADLYRKAAQLGASRCPELDVRVFSDRAIALRIELLKSTNCFRL